MEYRFHYHYGPGSWRESNKSKWLIFLRRGRMTSGLRGTIKPGDCLLMNLDGKVLYRLTSLARLPKKTIVITPVVRVEKRIKR